MAGRPRAWTRRQRNGRPSEPGRRVFWKVRVRASYASPPGLSCEVLQRKVDLSRESPGRCNRWGRQLAKDRANASTRRRFTAYPLPSPRSGWRVLRIGAAAAGFGAGYRMSKCRIPGRLHQFGPHGLDEHVRPNHARRLNAPHCLCEAQPSRRLHCATRGCSRRAPLLNGRNSGGLLAPQTPLPQLRPLRAHLRASVSIGTTRHQLSSRRTYRRCGRSGRS
jgi:hypothetical protein